MKMLEGMRVHIAPVGFEVDRIVLPANMRKADRVWLLVHNNASADKADQFIAEIKKRLDKSGIETRDRSVDRTDLFDIMREVRGIIKAERDAGNVVFVNVASGSKIQAIGCMMACMTMSSTSGVVPFYPEAKEYVGYEDGRQRTGGGAIKQQSIGVKKIVQLPTYGVQVPDGRLVAALGLIRDSGGTITKKELARVAEEKGIIVVNARREEHRSMVRYTTLDKTIIQPLKDRWKLVNVEKIGRNHHVRINDDGLHVVQFLGAPAGAEAESEAESEAEDGGP